MPWTYILRCADGSLYVGSARDLDERMTQHSIGTAGSYTATRRPVALAWALESERIDEAYALERKIKGWRRAKRLALIEGRFADLPALSSSGSHQDRGSIGGHQRE
jgi:putative endonuclease